MQTVRTVLSTASEAVLERARRIRLVVLDVDGVLTDGSIWTGASGESVKRFHARDGLGIKMLQAAGIPVAILTGRVSEQTAARARELGITSVAQGRQFKTESFRALMSEHGVAAEACAYMGDDVPDLPVLAMAGLAAAPADAGVEVLELAHWRAPHAGGCGAVRDLSELILRAQDLWDALVQRRYVRGEIGPAAGASSS